MEDRPRGRHYKMETGVVRRRQALENRYRHWRLDPGIGGQKEAMVDRERRWRTDKGITGKALRYADYCTVKINILGYCTESKLQPYIVHHKVMSFYHIEAGFLPNCQKWSILLIATYVLKAEDGNRHWRRDKHCRMDIGVVGETQALE